MGCMQSCARCNQRLGSWRAVTLLTRSVSTKSYCDKSNLDKICSLPEALLTLHTSLEAELMKAMLPAQWSCMYSSCFPTLILCRTSTILPIIWYSINNDKISLSVVWSHKQILKEHLTLSAFQQPHLIRLHPHYYIFVLIPELLLHLYLLFTLLQYFRPQKQRLLETQLTLF